MHHKSESPMPPAGGFPQPGPLHPIKSWDGVPPDISGAEINGVVVRDFKPLLALKKLRTLRAVCDTAKQLEIVGTLGGLRWLALDHCGAQGLVPIAGLARLEALSLFAFKAATLAGLEGL